MLPVIRWQARQSPVVRYLLILAVVVAAIGLLLLALGLIVSNGTPLVVGGAVAVAWAIFEAAVLRWSLRRGRRRALEGISNAGPRTMTFSDESVTVATNLTTAVHAWEVYSETLEKDAMYLLRLAAAKTLRMYVYVPKRAFKTAQNEALCRQLVVSHTNASLTATTQNDTSIT